MIRCWQSRQTSRANPQITAVRVWRRRTRLHRDTAVCQQRPTFKRPTGASRNETAIDNKKPSRVPWPCLTCPTLSGWHNERPSRAVRVLSPDLYTECHLPLRNSLCLKASHNSSVIHFPHVNSTADGRGARNFGAVKERPSGCRQWRCTNNS